MTILPHIRNTALIAASVAMLGVMPALADTAFVPSETELARWQASLDGLRDMTPKWGVQPVEAFKTTIDAGVPIVMIDVRTPKEWEEGIVEGAMTLSLNNIPTAEGLAKLPADRNAAIGVYCKSGHRSALALSILHQLGYKNALNMAGGYLAWKKAEYPITITKQ